MTASNLKNSIKNTEAHCFVKIFCVLIAAGILLWEEMDACGALHKRKERWEKKKPCMRASGFGWLGHVTITIELCSASSRPKFLFQG